MQKLSGQTPFFQATDQQVNDEKWNMTTYPASVTGAGVSGSFEGC